MSSARRRSPVRSRSLKLLGALLIVSLLIVSTLLVFGSLESGIPVPHEGGGDAKTLPLARIDAIASPAALRTEVGATTERASGTATITSATPAVTGQVRRRDDHRSLAGARVEVCGVDRAIGEAKAMGQPSITDGDGLFSCVIVDLGDPLYLRVSLEHYQTRIVGPLDGESRCIVELEDARAVSFKVVYDDESPVQSTPCQVMWREGGILFTSGPLVTDAVGRVQATCPLPCRGFVRLDMAGGGFFDGGFVLSRNRTADPVTIRVPRRVDRALRVVDRDGVPILGARVRSANEPRFATVTDASGQAVLPVRLAAHQGLPLLVDASGYTGVAHRLTHRGDAGAVDKIVLKRAAALLGRTGDGAGGSIWLRGTAPRFGRIDWEHRAGVDPEWRVDEVPADQDLVLLLSSSRGTVTHRVITALAPGEVRDLGQLAPSEAWIVRGRLESEARRSATVLWRSWAEVGDGRSVVVGGGQSRSDVDGTFLISAVGGTAVDVRALAASTSTASVSVEVGPGREAEVRLVFGAMLPGSLVDNRGENVPDAWIVLSPMLLLHSRVISQSDEQGRFTLHGLVAGAEYLIECKGAAVERLLGEPRLIGGADNYLHLVAVRRKER